mmetsp:Transcript_14423/g.24430  ORF Transcript_14423/g.24430 Transcript_14423/m.24430 type:complete len:274 (-) Transcript_14423:86-907(-)
MMNSRCTSSSVTCALLAGSLPSSRHMSMLHSTAFFLASSSSVSLVAAKSMTDERPPPIATMDDPYLCAMPDAKGERKSFVTLTRSPPEKVPGLPFLPGIYLLARSAFALANFCATRKLFTQLPVSTRLSVDVRTSLSANIETIHSHNVDTPVCFSILQDPPHNRATTSSWSVSSTSAINGTPGHSCAYNHPRYKSSAAIIGKKKNGAFRRFSALSKAPARGVVLLRQRATIIRANKGRCSVSRATSHRYKVGRVVRSYVARLDVLREFSRIIE